MDEIINVIGKEAATKLSESFGGRTLYFSKNPKDDVINAIGYQADKQPNRIERNKDGVILNKI